MTPPLQVPRLEGRTVVLRGWLDQDAPLVQQVATDPYVPLVTSVPTTSDGEAALAFVDRQRSRADTGEGYSFAVVHRLCGDAVGQAGLWLRDAAEGRASVGYWVVTSHRRRGVAGEALAILTRWGLGLPGIHRVQLYVEPWNEASWRAAESAGYRREGLLRGWQRVGAEWRDMFVYGALAADHHGGAGL